MPMCNFLSIFVKGDEAVIILTIICLKQLGNRARINTFRKKTRQKLPRLPQFFLIILHRRFIIYKSVVWTGQKSYNGRRDDPTPYLITKWVRLLKARYFCLNIRQNRARNRPKIWKCSIYENCYKERLVYSNYVAVEIQVKIEERENNIDIENWKLVFYYWIDTFKENIKWKVINPLQ